MNVKAKKNLDIVNDSVRGKIMNQESGEDIYEYEEQYNAAHDFAIFQVGNDAVGGLMNLEQKQNQAEITEKSVNTS